MAANDEESNFEQLIVNDRVYTFRTRLRDVLGRGTFGTVYKGTCVTEVSDVCIRIQTTKSRILGDSSSGNKSGQ